MVKPYMKKTPLYKRWLDRSRSNLERARIDNYSRYILYEDMCFDCQQSVEKAIKSLLVFKDIDFEWTHDIGKLINNMVTNKIKVPNSIKKSASLSVYAVKTRYPGEDEPVTKDEFLEALNLSETVYNWVNKIINKN